jgi:hypothetical protein
LRKRYLKRNAQGLLHSKVLALLRVTFYEIFRGGPVIAFNEPGEP